MIVPISKILPIVFFSVIISMGLCVYVSTHFFFDKFYYYKSTAFGYYIPHKKNILSDFGRRSEDLSHLLSDIKTAAPITLSCPIPKHAAVEEDDVLRIALIGDSYIWGQGLTNRQLAAVKLEKLLQRKTKSKVYLFGSPGDTILDNYIKYRYIRRDFPTIDIFVFGMVDNDLLFKKDNDYDQEFFDSFISLCPGTVCYQPTYDPFIEQQEISYDQQVRNSFSQDYANTCILGHVASLLPRDAIYFNFDDHTHALETKGVLSQYSGALKYFNLYVLSMNNKVSDAELKNQFVSKKEQHPSAVMNTAYARVLFEEIEKRINSD